MLGSTPTEDRRATRLAVVSTVLSVLLLGGLFTAYLLFSSHLALAQAADSLSDIVVAVGLLTAIRIARRPADEGHPLGHQTAEPIAALLAAVVAGVLAVEVMRDAITALLTGARPELDLTLLGLFVAKAAAKTVIAQLSREREGRRSSPALRALHVDARNDVAVGLVAVAGFFGARFGWASLDAWLAIAVALWVGWSGIDLARENIGMLMGETAPVDRRAELCQIAGLTPGVRSAHHLKARFHGPELDVLVHVVVDPTLTVRLAHDIGEAVEQRLIKESDVCHAVVHVDVDPP